MRWKQEIKIRERETGTESDWGENRNLRRSDLKRENAVEGCGDLVNIGVEKRMRRRKILRRVLK